MHVMAVFSCCNLELELWMDIEANLIVICFLFALILIAFTIIKKNAIMQDQGICS